MKMRLSRWTCGAALALVLTLAWPLAAQQEGGEPTANPVEPGATANVTPAATPAPGTTPAAAAQAAPWAALLKDAEKIDGLIPLHRKGTQLYAELGPNHYNAEYIVLISIARGIGQGSLLGGMSWGFGDDWVWLFRKIDDRVYIIRKNVRFRAEKGSPEATAVLNAYTDSVLFALPIASKGPSGGDLIDLTPVFMSDLPQISQSLPGFAFSQPKSLWASVKGFKDNIELQVAATYASGGNLNFDTVPDSRGVTINVHYSISKIPTTGYQPRLADDRIGYFLTAVKDFSNADSRDQFVRYINRWHLEKAEPNAKLSAPKQPLIFWIEKTVPFKYRKPIRDGILAWNKAYEAAGFIDAIEVRQQPDDATWDPEDINYNTFRWITSNAGFAMGPSRVNPYTGQILDADIIFDADFVNYWKSEFDTLTPQSIAAMTGGPLSPEEEQQDAVAHVNRHGFAHLHQCLRGPGLSREFALGAAAMAVLNADPAKVAEEREKLIMQGLKEVAMHEVGHTLGLRHNFKASRWRSLADINDPAKADEPTVASVMDYSPANIMPDGKPQGPYFSQTVGPYDIWAIEYGYKPLPGGTKGEVAELKKIAARSGEPGLTYATDEDTRAYDPDPHSQRFDLGSDPVEFAQARAELVGQVTPSLVERLTKEGDDYVEARRAFNVLLSVRGQAAFFAARYVGGMVLSRSHKGDKDAPPPVAVLDAKEQRAALEMLEQNLFGAEAWRFSPELYNHLGKSNWRHWGTSSTTQADFPIHDIVLMWQERVLAQLLSATTLQRLQDSQLRLAPDDDAFTSAELIERLTKAVFSEVDTLKQGEYTNQQPAIDSTRRNLQRSYLSQLTNIALGRRGAPPDCSAVAAAELSALQSRIDKLLKGKVKLDTFSRAHLMDCNARIEKALDARVVLPAL